ncbi:MAG TPA: hypothetical protein VD887_08660 [Allosphingosinicella sp.]|nr:hypothetical protein [Allosphingosinicella sp.]
MLTGVLFVLLALFGRADAPAPAPCSDQAVRERGAAVAEARARLSLLPVGEMETRLSPAAQVAIETLKDRLVEFVELTVVCSRPAEAAEPLEERLAALSDAAPPRLVVTPEEVRDMHGAWLTYEAAVPSAQPGLLAVVVRFGIECGEDALFLLFDRRAGVRALMVRRSPPYDEISGGYQQLTYSVSPPDRNGRWYVATASTRPWCSSAWRGIVYDLSRPGPDPQRPRIFYERTVSGYIGNDILAVLRAEADRFQIEHDGGIVDTDIIVRRHVETYALDGDAVRRIQPAAFNVRDFVDAWIGAPWTEAGDWSAPAPAIADAHRRLSALEGSEGVGLGFGPIRRCRSGATEVRLDPRRYDNAGGRLAPWYVYVRGPGPFQIAGAGQERSEPCLGPDLRAEIERESLRRRGVPG